MTPIPAELGLSKTIGSKSPDQSETKCLRLATENLVKACQERGTQIHHHALLHLPLNWINDETRITARPSFHLRVPTDLLVKVCNSPLTSEEEQRFLADAFGLEVKIDRQTRVLSLRYDEVTMKIYIGDTGYFGPLSPLGLLIAGFFVLPDGKTFLRAAKSGLVVGSFDKAEETIMAVPGRIMTECGAETIPWLRSFRDDYLYPVSLNKDRYVKHKNTNPKHRTEILTAPSLLFHHDSGFFHVFKPVALQTNTNQPKSKK